MRKGLWRPTGERNLTASFNIAQKKMIVHTQYQYMRFSISLCSTSKAWKPYRSTDRILFSHIKWSQEESRHYSTKVSCPSLSYFLLLPYFAIAKRIIQTGFHALRLAFNLADAMGELSRWHRPLRNFDINVIHRADAIHQAFDSF